MPGKKKYIKKNISQSKKEEDEDPLKEPNYDKLNVEEELEFKPPKMISAVTVLLNAVQLAQDRGAYTMNEIGIIHKAYELLLQHEKKRDEKLREQDDKEFIETAKELIEIPKEEKPEIIL